MNTSNSAIFNSPTPVEGITQHSRFPNGLLVPGCSRPVVVRKAGEGEWFAQARVASDYNIGAIGQSPKEAFLNMQAGYFDWLMEHAKTGVTP